MPIRSFRDPVTNVLKCSGYVLTNQPGDISQIEPDDFNQIPGRARWNGTVWVPFTPPFIPSSFRTALDTAIADLTIPQNVRNVLIGLRIYFNIQ